MESGERIGAHLVPRAVSVAVYEDESRERVLAVRRPEEAGETFAGMWGLPAATVGEGESDEDAVRRLGQRKLGMTLDIVREISQGTQERDEGELTMVLYEARAEEGEPKLIRAWDPKGVTYYTKWKWVESSVFEPTAKAGSLCCKLFLEAEPAPS